MNSIAIIAIINKTSIGMCVCIYIYTQKTDIGIDTDVDIKKIRAQSSIRKSNHNTMN